jgi:hypothetical protein
MSDKRRKMQLPMAFATESWGEPPMTAVQGIELAVARQEAEMPARPSRSFNRPRPSDSDTHIQWHDRPSLRESTHLNALIRPLEKPKSPPSPRFATVHGILMALACLLTSSLGTVPALLSIVGSEGPFPAEELETHSAIRINCARQARFRFVPVKTVRSTHDVCPLEGSHYHRRPPRSVFLPCLVGSGIGLLC